MQHKVIKYEKLNNIFYMDVKVSDKTKNDPKIQWQF